MGVDAGVGIVAGQLFEGAGVGPRDLVIHIG
jgi:hypothetical protein